jgi:hypothetical protein
VGDFNVMHDLEVLAEDLHGALQDLATAAGLQADAPEPAPEPDQPWAGYDKQTVAAIAKGLQDAGGDLAVVVRSYELGHKQRRGVLQATERQLTRG